MAELADAQDLGSCEEIRVGSTPTTRTKLEQRNVASAPFFCGPCILGTLYFIVVKRRRLLYYIFIYLQTMLS